MATIDLTGSATSSAVLTATLLKRPATSGVAGDYLVDPEDLALLRSPSQRFTLRAAFTPAYTPTVSNRLRGSAENMRDAIAWTPDAGIGPNQVGIVGVPVSYYLLGSKRNGAAVPAANQSMDWDDGTVVTPVTGIAAHTYTAAGTYEVKFSCTDSTSGVTFVAHRWVKIFDTWAGAYDGIVEVGSISGSSSQGGWSVSLKVTSVTGDYLTGDFPDHLGVILYVDQQWDVDDARGLGTTRTPNRSDGFEWYPNYLFAGYIVGSSVRVDADTHSVTFEARTAEYFLQRMNIYEMAWLDSSESGYGHIISGLMFSDVSNHLIYQHSNFGKWHSFYSWREAWPDANTYKRITLNEGTIWSALQNFATNEFGRLSSSRYSSLAINPDINVRGLTWWGSIGDPPELPFDEGNCLSIDVTETLPTIGAVELEAANPFKGTTLTAKYPSSPGDIGDREIVQGLTCEVQANLDAWAERLFYARNARYAVRVATAMPKILDIDQRVVVDYADPQERVDLTGDVGGGAMRKPFYVTDIGYTLDPGQGTWTATFGLGEIVRTRWNLTTQKWQIYNGSSWEDA